MTMNKQDSRLAGIPDAQATRNETTTVDPSILYPSAVNRDIIQLGNYVQEQG